MQRNIAYCNLHNMHNMSPLHIILFCILYIYIYAYSCIFSFIFFIFIYILLYIYCIQYSHNAYYAYCNMHNMYNMSRYNNYNMPRKNYFDMLKSLFRICRILLICQIICKCKCLSRRRYVWYARVSYWSYICTPHVADADSATGSVVASGESGAAPDAC